MAFKTSGYLARIQYFPKSTYLQTRQFFPLRREEEEEALGGPGQREAPDQQRDHHHVGEQGREVSHLARAAHTLPEHTNSWTIREITIIVFRCQASKERRK